MDEACIVELLKPFLGDSDGGRSGLRREKIKLSAIQLKRISIYVDLLLRWNARINLTAVREPKEIVTRHFGESLFAARLLFPREDVDLKSGSRQAEPHVIDVGSGAGFPGLPFKIWSPRLNLTLIEANHKKATFLREVVRNLELSDIEVFAGRAETYAGSKGDVVTLRAVERFELILSVAKGLATASGCVALLIGETQLKSIEGVAGLKWDRPTKLPLSSSRLLIVGSNESSL